MDAFLPQGIRDLAGQGTGWLAACLLTGVCWWLLKLLLESKKDCMTLQKECGDARDLSHEKRIAEATTTALALRSSADASAVLAQSIRDRTVAFDNLATLVTQMARDMEVRRPMWIAEIESIKRSLADIQSRVEAVQRGGVK